MPGLHVTQWGDGERVVLVHGSLATGPEEWEGQQPLAQEGFALVVADRRGYGESPHAGGEDFIQDGEDVAELLEDGAHLVGHSYGGLSALVAAERRPEAVLSLSLLEPPAFALCPDHPAVAAFVPQMERLWAQAHLSDREFLDAFLEQVGSSPEEVPDELLELWTPRVPVLRHGRPTWEALIPLEPIAATSSPKLVVSGDHHAAFTAVCEELARHLDARHAVVRGAGHEIQMVTDECNRVLLELWRSA